ncbi:unnamed protein product [Rotaria magnacalcarata]|uniref:Uncharacterized protein n=5 Tax=Rotaria magnacalcarata TaxID=392030 RepID=A0A816RNT7_9BILA|nr:unnamed protein product [Rotaria magnacalcarata]
MRKKLILQFIYHPNVTSIETYLMAFDLDIIQMCFNGEKVLCTWACIRALNTGTFICYNLTNNLTTLARSAIRINSHLVQNELLQRQQATQISDSSILNNIDDSREPFCLSSIDIKELSTRLQVNESIIICNANRLRVICDRLLELHEYFRRRVLERPDVALKEPTLNSKKMSLILEFFLQIDVDVFYMKTCRFRDAEPCPSIQGLFCNDESPKTRYSMVPCGTTNCPCCHSIENSSSHRFVNGYTTYLNCPATCTTSNIVFVMTCPCGQYEFLDSTSGTLVDALRHHRLVCNQMIHSYLTGSALYHQMMTTSEQYQHYIMREMRLYEHSAHCPVALQLFLDRNPNYWCFIPMLEDETHKEDDLYARIIEATRSEIILMLAVDTEHQRKIIDLLCHVPLSSTRSKFSCVQKHEQRLFFDRFLTSPVDELPYIETDLYQMKIIAVLPTDESIILRYLIETLFIIHCETKLNMICPTGIDPKRPYGLPYDPQWKSQMPRPTLRSTEFILSIIEKIKELNRRPSNNPE